jgi:DNA-binding PadR family transcriptional regulator
MQDRELPGLTHLQFLVLGVLLSGQQSGRVIRQAIERYGIRRSAPAFYQMMARLERDRMVEGWYEQVKVGDQSVTERRYRPTAAGSRMWERAYAFYEGVRMSVAGETVVRCLTTHSKPYFVARCPRPSDATSLIRPASTCTPTVSQRGNAPCGIAGICSGCTPNAGEFPLSLNSDRGQPKGLACSSTTSDLRSAPAAGSPASISSPC